MNQTPQQRRRTWSAKFRDALRGVGAGVRGQSSFLVHLICAAGVVLVSAWAQLNAWQWCVMLLCVALVLVSEMFNTSLEAMAKAIDTNYHPQLRDALDIASGAVLLASGGAVVVGTIVLTSAFR